MSTDPNIEEDIAKRLGKISEPILLYEGLITCPICNRKSLRLKEYLYEVPYFNKILITTGKCSNCGYTYRDVRLAEVTKPKKIVAYISGEEELRYLLVKSAYAYLSIPEKGYEMIPGPASQGFITTIEGVLHRFMEALNLACKNAVDNNCVDNRKWIEEAIEGKREFTLIICDYEGASKIIGEKVVEENLDKYCIEKKPEWMVGKI